MRKRLPDSESHLFDILDSLPEAIFVLNKKKNIIFWNKALEKMTGVKKYDTIGKSEASIAQAIYGVDFTPVNKVLRNNFHDNNSVLFTELFIPSFYEGKGAYVWIKATRLFDSKGQDIGTIKSIFDITQLKIDQEAFKYSSLHDKLTGLYNRNYAETELKRLDAERQLPISLIMGDLNNLKLTNDIFGHHMGDNLLVIASKILTDACREEDIVSRWGGDEFVIILPRTNAKTVKQVVNRIHSNCAALSGQQVFPSIAIGAATKTIMKQDIFTKLNEAEHRMYHTKFIEEKQTHTKFIEFLKQMLWKKNIETEDHCDRLKIIASQIGKTLQFSESQMEDLIKLSVFHDIGEIAIPDKILTKPVSLSEQEWQMVSGHVETGYRIAQSYYALSSIAQAILNHHERWDGRGYPQGLTGEHIPILSRILSIIDAYDVMLQGRPYQKPMTKEKALREIQKGAGTQFDPNLVSLFVNMMPIIDQKLQPFSCSESLEVKL